MILSSLKLIQRNDILKVLPGCKIPTDGVVVKGTSEVDESMITGESIPGEISWKSQLTTSVSKKVNSIVIGGSINQHHVMYIRATHLPAESMLAQIYRLIEDAQMSKTNVQRQADRFGEFNSDLKTHRVASIFVPIIVIIGVLTILIWLIVTTQTSYDTRGMSPFAFSFRFGITGILFLCSG